MEKLCINLFCTKAGEQSEKVAVPGFWSFYKKAGCFLEDAVIASAAAQDK
jgi:hypothetical protein